MVSTVDQVVDAGGWLKDSCSLSGDCMDVVGAIGMI